MKAEEIITKVFDGLKKEFDSNLSNEEIEDLKNGFLNKFYKDNMSKYDYELRKYRIRNLFDRLQNLYKENDISESEKTIVFKSFYRSLYKEGLYKNDELLIPYGFDDLEYIEQKCFEKDYKFIAAVLIQNDKKEEIYKYLKNNIFYQMFKSNHFIELIKIVNRNKNNNDLNIYDSIFDDFCMHDRYFFSIENFLENDCNILTSNNILSLLRHIDKEGIEKKVGSNSYNKCEIIYDIIQRKKIKFVAIDGHNDSLNLDIFKSIRNEEESILNIKKILEVENYETNKKIKDKKV